MSMKHQKGAGILPVVLALLGIGTASVVGTVYVSSEQDAAQTPQLFAEDINQIQQAVNAYMDDNNLNSYDSLSGAGALQTLVDQGYFSGDLESPMGTLYTSRVVDDKFEIVVNADQSDYATAAASLVVGGQASGSTLVSSLPLPSRSEEYDDYVGRYDDPDRPERQAFQTDIDLNDNDIEQAVRYEGESLNTDTLDVESVDADEYTINSELDIGSNASMTESAGTLQVNTSRFQVNGNAQVRGDLTGSGGQVTGASRVQSTNVVATDTDATTVTANSSDIGTFNATDATVTNVEGSSVDFDSANISTVNTDSVESSTANIGSLSGDTVSFSSADIDQTTTDSLQADSGSITTLSGGTASFNSGTIQTVSSSSLSSNTANIRNMGGQQVNYSQGNLNSADTESFSASNANINTLSGTGIDYSQGSVDTFNANTGNITNIDGTRIDTSILDAQRINTGAATVNGYTDGNQLDVNNTVDVSNTFESTNTATVSNTVVSNSGSAGSASGSSVNAGNMTSINLVTATVTSNSSNVGNASASSLNVSGTLSSGGLDTNRMDVGSQLDFNSASGDSLNISGSNLTASVGDFSPGSMSATTATSSADVYSSLSSINQNHAMINNMQDDLDECMYDTKWCFPQQPRISQWYCASDSTLDCNQSFRKSNFTARLYGQLTDCRHGCSYSWTLPSGFSGSGCGNGAVSEGGTKTVSCDVSNSSALSKQEGISGTVSLTVVSDRDSSLTDSRSQSVQFYNNTPADPFADHSFSFSYSPAGRNVSYSGTAGGSGRITASFSPSSGFTSSDYDINVSDRGLTSASYCNATVSGNQVTIENEGGNYDDCSGNARITATYTGDTSSEFYNDSDSDDSLPVTVGSSDSAPQPFEGFTVSGTCSAANRSWSKNISNSGDYCGYMPGDSRSRNRFSFNTPSSFTAGDYSITHVNVDTPSCVYYSKAGSPTGIIDGPSVTLEATSSGPSACEGEVTYEVTHIATGDSEQFSVGVNHVDNDL